MDFDGPSLYMNFYNELPSHITQKFDLSKCIKLQETFFKRKNIAQNSESLCVTAKYKDSATLRKDTCLNKQANFTPNNNTRGGNHSTQDNQMSTKTLPKEVIKLPQKSREVLRQVVLSHITGLV
ncbi:hypothetical protein DSO57_1010078 [Entomophthora muscae]|uniref:Uncharacterized protein n=1 Tax=Entomophthora muscae TaxID=34485 RepID=A0ACC2SJK5_9FUNG|nr:hypothetical protein DSO57_1010078 [Entomophthora muscae]